jgi:hypothetical protein
LTQLVRQMLALAMIHPRSAKAGGGVRIAALAVLAALLEYDPSNTSSSWSSRSSTNSRLRHRRRPVGLATALAPWSLDVLQVCLKALRSAGTGEPTFRRAAIDAARATATACRAHAASKLEDPNANSAMLMYPGAMEEKAIVEAIKVLKQAATDKFPEIRHGAAIMASTLAPLLVASSPVGQSSSSGTMAAASSGGGTVLDSLSALEEVLQLALRNIDDEYPLVAAAWAQAVSYCLATALQANQAAKQAAAADRGGDASGGGGGTAASSSSASSAAAPTQHSPVSRFGVVGRKPVGLVYSITSVQRAMHYLVDQFVSVGGELVAARAGGTFSTGGRMVRIGYSLALTDFLHLQTTVLSAIGESQSTSIATTLQGILEMVGPKMNDQLKATTSRTWSKADSGLARVLTSRVIRRGLAQRATEPFQLSILQEVIGMLSKATAAMTTPESVSSLFNANQLQVLLIELSHLFAALGEATASQMEEALMKLHCFLSHADGAVRSEASIACSAIVACFPLQGGKLIETSIQVINDELALLGSTTVATTVSEPKSGLSGFRRAGKPQATTMESWRSHEFSIHGRSLLVSMMVKNLTSLPIGLSQATLSTVLGIAEKLVSSQFNSDMMTSKGQAVCTCVRSGFCIISGALSTGPEKIGQHMSQIIGVWQKAGKALKTDRKGVDISHDLAFLDAFLSSKVAFLKFCSELLLSIPEALSQVTILLEDMFALVQPDSRLGTLPSDASSLTLHETIQAALLEAFAWLPSGSFPLVADEVFSFAADHIRQAVDRNVCCSILHSLIAKEDSLLDSKPFSRANRDGQVGDARAFEEVIVMLNAEIALQDECESTFHLRSNEAGRLLDRNQAEFRGSSILQSFACDTNVEKPPTPLHEVGTWRRPVDPSVSSKVRIIDAAIQAFSTTFGLKDGKEQQGAMDMLEQLVPRSLGMTTATSDNERKIKVR